MSQSEITTTAGSQPASEAPKVGAEELLRADFYDFLASLLSAPPDAEKLRAMAALEGGEDEIGRAVVGVGFFEDDVRV